MQCHDQISFNDDLKVIVYHNNTIVKYTSIIILYYYYDIVYPDINYNSYYIASSYLDQVATRLSFSYFHLILVWDSSLTHVRTCLS